MAGLATGTQAMRHSSAADRTRPRVIIAGAGCAGLACAWELAARGCSVQVFEARDRVGGRVLSLSSLIPGLNVEAGGELLGANHAHVQKYARRFGLAFLPITESPHPSPVILRGRRVPPVELTEALSEVESAFTLMSEAARAINAEEPWLSVDARQLDLKPASDWIAALDASPLAKELLTLSFTADNGVSTDRQSYLANLAVVKGGGLERYWTDTEMYRLEGGNQQLALRMAADLGPDRLRLNCPVQEIRSTDRGMIVVDAQGIEHSADDVVLAVPPSVWKRIRITPALPPVLQPQMGMSVKYLSVVRSRFWEAAGLSPDGNSDGLVSSTWHGTDGQAENSEAALVAFTSGPPAGSIHNTPPKNRESLWVDALEALYPGFRAEFRRGRMVDWLSEEWTEAGYSFPAPGEVTTVGPLLRSGLGHLHFAGEHTCYPFIGYIEGALHSGATLARRLAERHGLAGDLP